MIVGAILTAYGWCAGPAKHLPKLSFLQNEKIKLGADLNLGGAITYLSASGSDTNLVNSWDWGRQIQMSYYSGPIPFTPSGKMPADVWRGLGWNPIQAGDHFGNPSRSVATSNDGRTIYVKCVPMQWPLDDEPLEGTFETWYSLEGATVRVRCRLNNARTDHTQWPARMQEMPAVYTNGSLHRLFTYQGDNPFTHAELTQVEHPFGKGGAPWAKWAATENWAALVNDMGWGIGVWNAACFQFNGGFVGEPGKGGPRDSATGYISPIREEILDHNIQHEYSYTLILGDLKSIRDHVYAHAARPQPPNYRFSHDRLGWRYVNATDTGWPIRNHLDVRLDRDDPQLIGPQCFWRAENAPVLYIRAALHSDQTEAEVFWSASGETKKRPSMRFPVIGDGHVRTYALRLADSPDYREMITGIRFDPVPSGKEGDWIKIESISFTPPEK